MFFVISGFLITSIIQKQIKNNSFSFKAFWARRVKRLYPALITVLITTLVVCYFYYLPDNFQELGTHTLSAIFGIGNISLYNSSIGYFSKDAESFTLLHTWSLGVEEQFYFLYVITFYIFFKFTPKYKDILILLLLLISLNFSIYCEYNKPSFGFYMFPARAWELLAGCLVAMKKDYLVKFLPNFKIITILSLTVILTSFFVLDKSKSTTNMVFLLPVLSTCIFLISSGESKLHFLNNSTLTYLGKISYSLYLWHWPLISIYNYLLYPEVSTFLDKVYILILTL